MPTGARLQGELIERREGAMPWVTAKRVAGATIGRVQYQAQQHSVPKNSSGEGQGVENWGASSISYAPDPAVCASSDPGGVRLQVESHWRACTGIAEHGARRLRAPEFMHAYATEVRSVLFHEQFG